MSKVDYCLKCPKWGGDGICNVWGYDDPSEPWCEQTLGGEYINEDPLEDLEPGSPEFFTVLHDHLEGAPGGEEAFIEIVKEFKKSSLIISIPSQRKEMIFEHALQKSVVQVVSPKIVAKPKALSEEWLMKTLHEKGSLNTTEILGEARTYLGRKLTSGEKCDVTDYIRKLSENGKIDSKHEVKYFCRSVK